MRKCEGCGAILPEHGGMVFCGCAPKVKRPQQPAPRPAPKGPGDFLSEMLAKVGIKAGDCGCNSHKAKMNEWGPNRCHFNKQEIVSWMQEEAGKRKLPFIRKIGEKLVDRAIRRGLEECVKHPKQSWKQLIVPTEKSVSVNRDFAVIMLGVGAGGESLSRFTAPFAKRYADKIGADFHLIDGELVNKEFPCGDKYRIRHWASKYKRSIYVDADIFVAPWASNLFEVVPHGSVGMSDVFWSFFEKRIHGVNNPWRDWLIPEVSEYMDSQGELSSSSLINTYLNSGLIVIDGKDVEKYFETPLYPGPTFWCAEENWCRRNVDKHKLTVFDIPRDIHWGWWWDRDFEIAASLRPHFFHLAGMGQNVSGWEVPDSQWRMRILRLLSMVLEQ